VAIEYDSAAEVYSRHRGVSPPVPERLLNGLPPDCRILDVGCGTGNYLSAIAEHAGCQLWGVEPSEQMLV
jgi:ubiquinone/menaquinone biosynthesis C-methylase UbiE